MTAIFQRNFDREIEHEARLGHRAITEPDIEEIRQSAFAEGKMKGRLEAEARMRASTELRRADALEAIRNEIITLVSQRETHERELEAHFLDYAMAVAEKVMPELVSSRAHQHVAMEIRRGLRMGLGSSHIKISLSARDKELIEEDLKELLDSMMQDGKVSVEVSATAVPGDIAVAWDRGSLDSSLSGICEKILGILRKNRRSESPRGEIQQTEGIR